MNSFEANADEHKIPVYEHFYSLFSDSSATQYKCVKNLFLLKILIHYEYGFSHVT